MVFAGESLVGVDPGFQCLSTCFGLREQSPFCFPVLAEWVSLSSCEERSTLLLLRTEVRIGTYTATQFFSKKSRLHGVLGLLFLLDMCNRVCTESIYRFLQEELLLMHAGRLGFGRIAMNS